MFLDRFVGQDWPGELAQSKYNYRILERGPEKAVLEFQTTTKRRRGFYRNDDIYGRQSGDKGQSEHG